MSKAICQKCGYADYIHDGGITCEIENSIRESERERIIKLLEDEFWHHMVIQMTNPPKRAHSYDCIGCKQIALIKGENK